METLLQQIQAIDEKLDALLASDEFGDDQKAEHDRLLKDREGLLARKALLEQQEARKREREALAEQQRKAKEEEERSARKVAAEPRRRTTPDQPGNGTSIVPANASYVKLDEQGRPVGWWEPDDEPATENASHDAAFNRAFRGYRKQKAENWRQLRSAGYVPWGEFRSASDFIRAGLDGHQQHAFRERHHRHFAAVQGMSEGVGSDGGYTVMPEFAMGIIDRVFNNQLWGRTDNYTVSGNTMTFLANAETSRATGSRHGGLRGYWLSGEGSTLTASKPTLREVTLKLGKLGVVVYLTQELLDDTGVALQQYVERKVGEEFNFMIGDALYEGTGNGQPLGLLNCPSLISIAKESGQLAATLLIENIEKMYARFFMPNLQRAYWYHNQDIYPQLDLMTLGIGTAGVPVYMPPGGVSAAPYGALKGRPLDPIEFASTLGTQGDLMLADLGQILSISKGGVAQAVSMHVQFLTDQLAVRFIMRLNAGPWENAALTPFKGSNTQSSFVTLDTRS